MRKDLRLLLAFLLVFGVGIGLGVYIRGQTSNPRATIPSIFERPLSLVVKEGEKEDDDLLYYDTDLSSFILNGSKRTKAAVVGMVDRVVHQPDGDYHVLIRDPHGLVLVAEFIPELKLPLPEVGSRIKIWGIVRYDVFHRWWELHPVIGWEKAK